MPDPVIYAKYPKKVQLESGKEYFWCACGKSKNQPFCDGSHAGTGLKPKKFVASEDGDSYLCQCKYTKNPPFCDGSHKNLDTAKSSKSLEGPSENQEEPFVEEIQDLAKNGLEQLGHHGEMGAMGVPRHKLPMWDDIQVITAQLHKKPLMEDVEVGHDLIIGPRAQKPLKLDIPLFVSDMSFGALSEEAKLALAKGAQLAGTGICSGEGGMLPEEQENNSRYLYELASGMFGYQDQLLSKVQAFHFKGGQGAKTGTGGHLPGSKVKGKIAAVRQLSEGQAAISPPTFSGLSSARDYGLFGDKVRKLTGGIPIGFKISAQHIEKDMDFALHAGADYIILDGRGGGTGAAPLLFRDHISVPTIPALARARRFLDRKKAHDVTLIITGGLRTPADFVKALCLGADGIAVSNVAMQAIGCIGARMCNTNNCPAGIATQDSELRKKIDVEVAAKRLGTYFQSVNELIVVLARACGYDHIKGFCIDDLTTWKYEMAKLSGISYGGVER